MTRWVLYRPQREHPLRAGVADAAGLAEPRAAAAYDEALFAGMRERFLHLAQELQTTVVDIRALDTSVVAR